MYYVRFRSDLEKFSYGYVWGWEMDHDRIYTYAIYTQFCNFKILTVYKWK